MVKVAKTTDFPMKIKLISYREVVARQEVKLPHLIFRLIISYVGE